MGPEHLHSWGAPGMLVLAGPPAGEQTCLRPRWEVEELPALSGNVEPGLRGRCARPVGLQRQAGSETPLAYPRDFSAMCCLHRS